MPLNFHRTRQASTTLPEGSATRPCILLVEDDKDQLVLFSKALTLEGYDVTVARTAQEAFAVLSKSNGIALIIADIGLPGDMDGIALGEAVQGGGSGTPVIFITGYPPYWAAKDERIHPDMIVLFKPFCFPTLFEKIEGILNPS